MKNLLKAQQRVYMSEMIIDKRRKLQFQFWLCVSILIIALAVAIIALFN